MPTTPSIKPSAWRFSSISSQRAYTSPRSSSARISGFTGKPSSASHASNSSCDFRRGPPFTAPMAYVNSARSRVAVMPESFCRRLPAAALRALVNNRSPASPWRRLSSSNAASGMKISPRTSSWSGTRFPFRRSGTASIVRRFSVTFSPVRPSPRVAPIVNRPPSYWSEIASPSSLGSATYRIAPGTSFWMRVPHASSSSRENALSSESIGSRCSTGANVTAGRPPGRCVGESGVTSSGCSASSARSSRTNASNSASDTSGASKTKYCSLW